MSDDRDVGAAIETGVGDCDLQGGAASAFADAHMPAHRGGRVCDLYEEGE
jgi:hypothetical protein